MKENKLRLYDTVRLVPRLQTPNSPADGTVLRLSAKRVLVLFPIAKRIWLNRTDVRRIP